MSESKQNLNGATKDSVLGWSVQRREKRNYVKVPVEVRLASGETHPGYSRDLTASSMGAVVSASLKIGEEVWLSFAYPVADGSSHQVMLQAIVRHRLGFRYGFEFRAPLDL